MSTSHLMHDDFDDEEDEVEESEEGALHSGSSKECITTDSQSEGGFKNDATPPQNRQARPPKMRSLSHDE